MSNEQFIALIKKNPITVVCIVLVIAIGLFTYYRMDELPEQDRILVETQTEAERLAANKKNSERLKDQYDALVVANKQIDARLIRMSDLTRNHGYFDKLEADTGVKLTLIQQTLTSPPPQGKGPKQVFTRVPFSITAVGDYASLLEFLRHLENGNAYCRVLSCTINAATPQQAGGERTNTLTLRLGLELLGLP